MLPRFELARRLARSAGQLTLKYFQTDLFTVERKQDGSPLTIADRETELYLRTRISESFPDDAIVGEEFPPRDGASGFRWAIDPIDGTKSFISGVPLYGTMVAVIDEREKENPKAIIGAVHVPGLDEGMYAAKGLGAWHYCGEGDPTRATVSKTNQLQDCVITTSSIDGFALRSCGNVLLNLAEMTSFSRTWGDVYGYMLLATGRADVVVDPEMKVWDAAAVQPIVEEAGGIFTDWRGNPTYDGGDVIATNGAVHEDILKLLETSRCAN